MLVTLLVQAMLVYGPLFFAGVILAAIAWHVKAALVLALAGVACAFLCFELQLNDTPMRRVWALRLMQCSWCLGVVAVVALLV